MFFVFFVCNSIIVLSGLPTQENALKKKQRLNSQEPNIRKENEEIHKRTVSRAQNNAKHQSLAPLYTDILTLKTTQSLPTSVKL